MTGNVTGNCSGTAATVTGAAQTAITSVGTLTSLKIADGATIGSASDPDAITIGSDGVCAFSAGLTGALTGNVTGNADTATKIASITNSDIVQLTATQTLTNKSLTSPTITGTGAIAGVFTGDLTGDVTGNAATATKIASITNSDIVQLAATQTLTNKSLTSPTITGTGAIAGVFTGDLTGDVTGNAATATKIASITNSDIVQLAATQTLTNKTLTAPTITGSGNIAGAFTGDLTGNVTGNADTASAAKANSALATALAGKAALAGATYTGFVTLHAEPTSALHAASKSYVDSVAAGLDPKESVRVATTAAGTLASSFANGEIVDGITLATGDRILIKTQADGSENGIYTVNASGAPTRATDFDDDAEVTAGAFTFVEEGTANASAGFVLATTGSITVGTTAMSFTQFSSAAALSAELV